MLLGMKELHQLINEVRRSDGLLSMAQLKQMCDETHRELYNSDKYVVKTKVFKLYYGMHKWTNANIYDLGKFLKRTDYKKVLYDYGNFR